MKGLKLAIVVISLTVLEQSFGKTTTNRKCLACPAVLGRTCDGNDGKPMPCSDNDSINCLAAQIDIKDPESGKHEKLSAQTCLSDVYPTSPPSMDNSPSVNIMTIANNIRNGLVNIVDQITTDSGSQALNIDDVSITGSLAIGDVDSFIRGGIYLCASDNCNQFANVPEIPEQSKDEESVEAGSARSCYTCGGLTGDSCNGLGKKETCPSSTKNCFQFKAKNNQTQITWKGCTPDLDIQISGHSVDEFELNGSLKVTYDVDDLEGEVSFCYTDNCNIANYNPNGGKGNKKNNGSENLKSSISSILFIAIFVYKFLNI